MAHEKSILVTGSPRSGTTWTGRVLAKAPGLHYVHEPFNIGGWPCACGTSFDRWFQYISAKNELKWYDHLKHILQSSPNRFNAQNALAQSLKMKRLGPLRDIVNRIQSSRLIVKDPLAVFSAEWLASTFDVQVVVLIRHPAAVVSSYKRLQWTHQFDHFLDQPMLITEHLYPFEAEIKQFASREHDIVDQAALLWKLIHHMIMYYQRVHPEWIFVRHEDLSRDPLIEFQSLFDHLNLELTASAKLLIEDSSNSDNPLESTNPYAIKLNSLETAAIWKKRLSPVDVERVWERVGEIGRVFYPKPYW